MIASISKNITQDYSKKTLQNIWVHYDEQQELQDLDRKCFENFTGVLAQADDSVICLYTPYLTSETIRLIEQIAKKNRIYLFTKDIQPNLNELSRHCLIRTGEYIAGSFALIKSKDYIEGFFSTNLFSIESNQLFVALDSNQCGEFWHYFLECFWKGAKNEYIAGEKKEVSRNHQEDFMPPLNNGFDREWIQDTISKISPNSLICLRTDSAIAGLIPSFDGHKFLIQDSKILGDEILCENTQSKFLVSNVGFESVNGMIVISDSNRVLYSMSVAGNQVELFKTLLKQLNKEATHSFKHSITLGEIVGKTISHLNGAECFIESSATHTDSIRLDGFMDKDEFESLGLRYEKIWQDNYSYACKVVYTFDVIPFYTPSSYKEAGLYKEWENTHKALQDEINKQLKGIEKTQEKQKELDVLGALLEGAKKAFARFFLGKNTNINDIKRKLENLKDQIDIEALNIDNTNDYKHKLEQYADDLNGHDKEVDSKLTEAREYNQWQEEKNKLKRTIEKKEKECESIEDNIQELEEKDNTQKDKIAQLQKEQKENETSFEKSKDEKNEVKLKRDSINKELGAIRHELDSVNKEYLDISKELKALNNQLNILQVKESNYGEE